MRLAVLWKGFMASARCSANAPGSIPDCCRRCPYLHSGRKKSQSGIEPHLDCAVVDHHHVARPELGIRGLSSPDVINVIDRRGSFAIDHAEDGYILVIEI